MDNDNWLLNISSDRYRLPIVISRGKWKREPWGDILTIIHYSFSWHIFISAVYKYFEKSINRWNELIGEKDIPDFKAELDDAHKQMSQRDWVSQFCAQLGGIQGMGLYER